MERRMRRNTQLISIALLTVAACGGEQREVAAVATPTEREIFVSTLFTGVEQYDKLNRLEEIFPVNSIAAADGSRMLSLAAIGSSCLRRFSTRGPLSRLVLSWRKQIQPHCWCCATVRFVTRIIG